jgi:hypothetical protein
LEGGEGGRLKSSLPTWNPLPFKGFMGANAGACAFSPGSPPSESSPPVSQPSALSSTVASVYLH